MKALITAAMITTLSFGGVALADQYEEYERMGNFSCLTDHDSIGYGCNSIESLPPTAAGRTTHTADDQDEGFNLNMDYEFGGN